MFPSTLDAIARNALVPLPGIDFILAIKDVQFNFDNKMAFITGHFLVSDNPGVQLAFPAVGFRC